ncbi:hypothetical protein BC936DRAFT_148106 [Jimgerdemannia flammicorona]|uniref:Uncharacterized protein n=1 Tax=Jimgerdemannia flammicorona TaxID=994334 RepID=A0A433D3R6_9FUNG|nr:hypothetical protein BC936DRAFT_148106 [Jimgerdemannia flammicorona]
MIPSGRYLTFAIQALRFHSCRPFACPCLRFGKSLPPFWKNPSRRGKATLHNLIQKKQTISSFRNLRGFTSTSNFVVTTMTNMTNTNQTQWFRAVHDADVQLLRQLHGSDPQLVSVQHADLVPYDPLMRSEATRLLGPDTSRMTGLQYALIHFDAEDPQPSLMRKTEDLITLRKNVVQFLIEASTANDLNAYRWGSDNTALHLASFLGEITIVQDLLTHGANPALQNGFGQTARDVALDDETRVVFDNFDPNIPSANKLSLMIDDFVHSPYLADSNNEDPTPPRKAHAQSLPLPQSKEAIAALRQNSLVSNSVFLNGSTTSPNASTTSLNGTTVAPGATKRPNYSSANRFNELRQLAESTVAPVPTQSVSAPVRARSSSVSAPTVQSEDEQPRLDAAKSVRKSETAALAKKSAVRNNPFVRSVEDLTSAAKAAVSTSTKEETSTAGSTPKPSGFSVLRQNSLVSNSVFKRQPPTVTTDASKIVPALANTEQKPDKEDVPKPDDKQWTDEPQDIVTVNEKGSTATDLQAATIEIAGLPIATPDRNIQPPPYSPPTSDSMTSRSPRSILRAKRDPPSLHRSGSGRARGPRAFRPMPHRVADPRKTVTWNEMAEVREIVELDAEGEGENEDEDEEDEDLFDWSSDDSFFSDEEAEYYRQQEEEEIEMVRRLQAEEGLVRKVGWEIGSVEGSGIKSGNVSGAEEVDEETIDEEKQQVQEPEPIKEDDTIETKINQVADLDVMAHASVEETIPTIDEKQSHPDAVVPDFLPTYPDPAIATPHSEIAEWGFGDVDNDAENLDFDRSKAGSNPRIQRSDVLSRLAEWRRSKTDEPPSPLTLKARPLVQQPSIVAVTGETDGKKVHGIFNKLLQKASGGLKRTGSWGTLRSNNASVATLDRVVSPLAPKPQQKQQEDRPSPLAHEVQPSPSVSHEGSTRSVRSSISLTTTSVDPTPVAVVQHRSPTPSPSPSPSQSLTTSPSPVRSASSSSYDLGRISSATSMTSLEPEPETRPTSPKLSSVTLQQRSPTLSPVLSPNPVRSSSSSSRASTSSDVSAFSRSSAGFADPVTIPIVIGKGAAATTAIAISTTTSRSSPPRMDSMTNGSLPSLVADASGESLGSSVDERSIKHRSLGDLMEWKRLKEEDNEDGDDEGEDDADGSDVKIVECEEGDMFSTNKRYTYTEGSISKLELEALRRRDFLLELPGRQSNGFEKTLLESIGGEHGPSWKVAQDAQRGGTFTKSRRVPASKAPAVKPATVKSNEPAGRLYVKVMRVADIGVPMPKDPTFVRCVLNDGRYEHFSRYTQLGRNVGIEQEFQM